MFPEFHTARGFQAFDRLVHNIEAWALHAIPSVGKYQRSTMVARTIQRIVEVALAPYLQVCAKRVDAGLPPLPPENQNLECGGLELNSYTGKVRPTFIAFLRALGDFWVHWGHALGVFTLAMAHRRKIMPEPATILFGVGRESIIGKHGDARFVAYCRQGPIFPLTSAQRLIVQAAIEIKSSAPHFFSYTRFPLHQLAQLNAPNWLEYLHFLTNHLISGAIYFWAVLRSPVICLLGRDFAYHAMVESLNRRKLIESVVITNSNYSVQPLWMRDLPGRHFSVHMVWYSQNTTPFTFAADPIRAPLPNNRHIVVDESWVWTEGYANYLTQLGIPGRFHVVGPIMWYLPKQQYIARDYQQIRVAIFDISPVRPETERDLGLSYNYYHTRNCIEFIEGIVATKNDLLAKFGININLYLKHKRSQHQIHDPEYTSFIEGLNAEVINLVPADSDIYELIAGCHLILVMPYSSPAYVADMLGVPAIYYDPSQELLPTYESGTHIHFASGRQQLLELTSSLLLPTLNMLAPRGLKVDDQ